MAFLNTTSPRPASIFALSDALGINENALVDAFLAAGNGKPETALMALVEARRAVDQLERYCVADLRQRRKTWDRIGMLLGVSRQAAKKRYPDAR